MSVLLKPLGLAVTLALVAACNQAAPAAENAEATPAADAAAVPAMDAHADAAATDAAPAAPQLQAAMRDLWHGHIVHPRDYALAAHAGNQAGAQCRGRRSGPQRQADQAPRSPASNAPLAANKSSPRSRANWGAVKENNQPRPQRVNQASQTNKGNGPNLNPPTPDKNRPISLPARQTPKLSPKNSPAPTKLSFAPGGPHHRPKQI